VDISTLATESTVIDVLLECAPIAIAISAQQLHRMTKRGVPAGFPRTIISTGAAVAIARDTDLDVHSLDEIREIEEPEASLPRVDECDAAMIICTSGTTGRSKGVMLSHRNLISNLLSVNSLMGLTHDDSMLLAVPLHYIHGRMQLLTHTLIGGTVAFSSGFHMPQSVLGELVKYKVSGFSGVPFHFKRLLERSALKTTPLPDLKYVVITGGAMPPAELQALAEAMPGVAIHVAYGLTEASPRIANLPPSDVTTRPTSCGRPIPGVSVEIVDDEGVRVTPGEVGEVVVSGPNVMLGYVSGDERELGTIDADGRLHTGDLGRMDADGYLYLVGRKSEMIKVAGERIFPAEI
jgi:acyl-CoA synthetase (AMP-forming)/AMP-acid ligase II